MDTVHMSPISQVGWEGTSRAERRRPLYERPSSSALVFNTDKSKVIVKVRRELAQRMASLDKHWSNEMVFLLYSMVPMFEWPDVQDRPVAFVVVTRQHKTMQAY